MQRILITGAAGFIGFHTCLSLLKKKHIVYGVDNLNAYYDLKLKKDRLKILKGFKNFYFFKCEISSFTKINKIFNLSKITKIVHLAAQAGVRYSIQNPFAYTKSNLEAFANILECSRIHKIKHLVFASSSSIYGNSSNFPLNENEKTNKPLSYYAATKLSNEMMGHSYSHLFKIPTTGLRFFTVYGPWGRPDMFLFLLVESIKKNKVINIFNSGKMYRDFTYITDIVEAIIKILNKPPIKSSPFKVFNIGSNKPIYLKKFISITEKYLNKVSKKNYLNMQKGDVKYTHASIKRINKWINYKPKVSVNNGVKKFIKWYESYYK